jgi:hypothetical protein
MQRALRAFYRVNQTMKDIIGNRASYLKKIREHKLKVVDAINRDKESIGFKRVVKLFGIHLNTFKAWAMGGNAKSITGHSGDNVLETYYLNKETIAKAANGFQVFAKPIDRVKELAQIRQTTTLKTRNKNQGREVSNSLKKGLEIG